MEEREPNLVTSSLSRRVTRDNITVELSIYRLESQPEWSLEVVNPAGTSIVWDDLFPSDEAANEAFKIILSDPKVKGILVNIFGGIARCDLIAEALVKAGQEIGFKVPVVVRLEGNQVEKARQILNGARAQLPTLIPANDLTDAAKKIVEAVGQTAVGK